jgi:hypothetical protein
VFVESVVQRAGPAFALLVPVIVGPPAVAILVLIVVLVIVAGKVLAWVFNPGGREGSVAASPA